MDLLRNRSTALWALSIALTATGLLSLSHLDIEHAENCPICHFGAHSFEPTGPTIELDEGTDPRQGWILPSDLSVPDLHPFRRPPGRAPPFLRAA